MKTSVRSAIKVLSGIGFLIAVFVILLALTAIQGMSGREHLVGLLFFFPISFAVAFGLGAACKTSFSRRHEAWPAAWAFATGGAVGGVFLVFALKSIVYFERQLRVLTGGGPLGIFLLAAVLGAVTIPIFVGTALLRKTNRH